MYHNFFIPIVESLNKSFQEVLVADRIKYQLTMCKDFKRVTKYFCALHKIGPELIDSGYTSLEIYLGNMGLDYESIMDIAAIIYLMQNEDYVLTTAPHFENAVTILNDVEVDFEKTEWQPPHMIAWGLIVLMALYNTVEFPLRGDAVRFLAKSFQHYGWVDPPIFLLDEPNVVRLFHLSDVSSLEPLKGKDWREIVEMSLSIKKPSNHLENYLKLHAPIFEYIKEQTIELKRELELVS